MTSPQTIPATNVFAHQLRPGDVIAEAEGEVSSPTHLGDGATVLTVDIDFVGGHFYRLAIERNGVEQDLFLHEDQEQVRLVFRP